MTTRTSDWCQPQGRNFARKKLPSPSFFRAILPSKNVLRKLAKSSQKARKRLAKGSEKARKRLELLLACFSEQFCSLSACCLRTDNLNSERLSHAEGHSDFIAVPRCTSLGTAPNTVGNAVRLRLEAILAGQAALMRPRWQHEAPKLWQDHPVLFPP